MKQKTIIEKNSKKPTDERQSEVLLGMKNLDSHPSFDRLTEGFAIYDRNGICQHANERFAKMVGIPPGLLIGQHLKDYLSPESISIFEEQLGKQILDQPETYELCWKDNAGKLTFTLIVPQTLVDEQNNFQASSIILADITSKKDNEKKVQQQLEMLNALHTGALELSKSLDLKELGRRMVETSVTTFGAKLAWLGQAERDGTLVLVNICPSKDFPVKNIIARWSEENEHPISQALTLGKPVITEKLELPDYPAHEEFFPDVASCKIGIFPLVSHDFSFGVLVIYSDQTDFFGAERGDFFLTYAQQAAAALENARLYGQIQTYVTFLKNEYDEKNNELKQRVAEVEELNATLARLLEDLQASNHRLEKTTQQLKVANTELESFSYSVSHDLKAPLRGIDGYSRLLMEAYYDRLDEEGRMFLGAIRKATAQMHRLIDDLLAYSRLERRSLSQSIISPQKLIEDLLSQREQDIREFHIKITFEQMCGPIQSDYESLSQALRNLIDNAIKFTRNESNPEIKIGGYSTDTSNVIWVKDNGIGFNMQFHDRIFDIFQRLHTTETYPGTGVGLAIVRRAIERTGGRVWAQSAPGQGATFYIEIPHPQTQDGDQSP
jgi:PAS domain S-box-containing protein